VPLLKVSDLVISRLTTLGISQAFSVTGGAAMHLNDSAGESEALSVLYMHNEQSCAMAAEGYARIARKPGLVIATAGPGAINTLNGVFGAFTDSIPMVVITGQARKNTQKSHFELEKLRQLGDQEAPLLEMVKPITKSQYEITQAMTGKQMIALIDKAYGDSISGRPGPVWIEIPVDVQGLKLEIEEVLIDSIAALSENSVPDIPSESLDLTLEKIQESSRPVLLLGTGVQLSRSEKEAIEFAEKFQLPILTAWAHDIVHSSHPLFMGRPGTIGSRPGNFILQQADLLIIVGSRLNIRQISYNYEKFAPKAFKIHVDIDNSELNKPFPRTDLQIHADAKSFFAGIMKLTGGTNSDVSQWMEWCRYVNQEFAIKDADYPIRKGVINAYHLIPHIVASSPKNSILVSGDATACIVPFQTAFLQEGMSLFSNSGCASMGYDLPAAIGAAIADPMRPVICFAGDGSIMMNIQELQTLTTLKSDFTLLILDNGGYLSIKQTQSNFFGRFHGSNPESGVTFPDFLKLSSAFGLNVIQLESENWRNQISENHKHSGVRVLVARLDREQEFEPRLKSRIENGVITTPELDDMYPHLPDDIIKLVRSVVIP
jgi:acetolactate synthase-1/2/3 large subunit